MLTATKSARTPKFSASHRKESMAGLDRVYKVLHIADKISEVVDARIYWSGTMATCTACIWIHSADFYASGSGKAIGGGYHKPSAAIADAINAAGIDLQDGDKFAYISGCGWEAVESALLAIARMVTPEGSRLHIVSGHA